MNRGFLIIALFAAIGIGMYYYLQPQGGGIESGDTVDVIIQDRHMDPSVIRTGKGSTIALAFRTDEEGTVIVEDYNISVVTALGRSVAMTIPASRAGAFPIVMYPLTAPKQKIRIGTLEVQESRKGW
jgi:hypothetical protein